MKEPQTEPETSTEAERFKDFARKIIAVPKKEIDKEQAKYERQREKEKRLQRA